MKDLFRKIGFATAMFLYAVSVNAAPSLADSIYDFGGTKVELLAVPCTDVTVVANLAAYGHAVSEFYSAVITPSDQQAIPACYAVSPDGTELDIHWGIDDGVIVDVSAGIRI